MEPSGASNWRRSIVRIGEMTAWLLSQREGRRRGGADGGLEKLYRRQCLRASAALAAVQTSQTEDRRWRIDAGSIITAAAVLCRAGAGANRRWEIAASRGRKSQMPTAAFGRDRWRETTTTATVSAAGFSVKKKKTREGESEIEKEKVRESRRAREREIGYMWVRLCLLEKGLGKMSFTNGFKVWAGLFLSTGPKLLLELGFCRNSLLGRDV